MVRKKYRILIRTFLLHLLNHRIGQFLVRVARRAPRNFWSRTKPFRIYLLAIPKIEKKRPDPNQNKMENIKIEGLPRFLIQDPANLNEVNFNINKKVIRILSPISKNGHHNILNLARYFGDYFSKSYPTTLLVSPTLEFEKSGNCLENLYSKNSDNFLENSIISIYHLGNNPNSGILLEDFFENSGQKIVVLHDLWLFDLYQHLGTHLGRNSLGFDMCQSSLGIYGTKGFSDSLGGMRFEDSQRLEIGKVFLEPIINSANKVIFHNKENIFGKWMLDEHAQKAIHINLPLGYPTYSNPITSNFLDIDTVLVSGKISEKYDLSFYQELIFILLQNPELKKVIVFGDVVDLLDSGKLIKLASSMKISTKRLLIAREFTDLQWDCLLRPNSLGIRLGVGFNGECSGIVRDFLGAGMTVITNEKIENLENYSRYFHVMNDADGSQIGNIVKYVLNRKEELRSVNDLNDYKLQSLSDYKDVFSKIERDFFNGI